MKKDIFIFVLKIIVAVATAILGVLGVSSLASCAAAQSYTQSKGKAVITVNDTTIIEHGGLLNVKIK